MRETDCPSVRPHVVGQPADSWCRMAPALAESQDAILLLELDGTISAWNRGAAALYGYTEREAIGMNVDCLAAPGNRDGPLEPIRRIAAGETIEPFETQRRGRDGRLVDVSVGMTALVDEAGAPVAVATIERDVTLRRQSELILSQRETRLATLLDGASDGIVIFDEAGVIRSMNEAAGRLFGYSPCEIAGRSVALLLPTLFDQTVARPLKRKNGPAAGGTRDRQGEDAQSLHRYDLDGRRADGERLPVRLTLSELDDAPPLFVGVIRDLAERKQVEEALRQQRDFAESLIETAHAIVLLLDSQDCVLRFNSYMEELSGYTLAEILGDDWFETFLPERDRIRMRALFRQAMNGAPVRGQVSALLTKDGLEREIAWWNKTLYDNAGEILGLLCIGHDITDLKKAQEQLVQSERLSAIGEAMAGLTHESRNALARSQSNLRMLTRRLRRERPELLKFIDASLAAQDEVRHLFEDVRHYAAPLKLNRQPCDLGALIRETWGQIRSQQKHRRASLVERGRAGDLVCDLDRLAMRNVFRNILENAVSACEDPVRVVVEYRQAELHEAAALSIAIRDNGPGLSPVDIQRAFDAFYTTKTHGTGLGLAIVRRTVREHGGEVFAGGRTDGEKGAEFIIILPRTRS